MLKKNVELWELSLEPTIRFDFNYINMNTYESETVKFLDLFEIITGSFQNNSLEGAFKYAEIGDVEKTGDVNFVELNYDDRNELNENYFKKIDNGDIIKPVGGDILISSVRPNLKKFVHIDTETCGGYFTKAFIHMRPKIGNSLLLYRSLRNIFFRNLISASRMGKGYPTLKKGDLKNIKFKKTYIDNLLNNSERLLKKIIPIENEIKELKSQLQDPMDVINRVFAREFGYNPELWKKFGKGMTVLTQKCENVGLRTYTLDFDEFKNSKILRFSTRYHTKYTQQLSDILNSTKTLKVNEIIKKPVKRGKQPVSAPEGEVYAIKTGQLKNKCLDLTDCTMVSEDFYNASERARTVFGDVLIASTGKGSLGKIDIVEIDEKLVVDGHISIVSIDKSKYDPMFFVLYLRSILGGFQFERDYTGATNQVELYPDEIHNFLVPDIELEKQKQIVDEITLKIEENNIIEKQIEENLLKIDEIMEEILLD